MTTRRCNDYNNYKDNMKCILDGARNDDALFEKELICWINSTSSISIMFVI